MRAYAGEPRRHSQSLRFTDVAATLKPDLADAGDGIGDIHDPQHPGARTGRKRPPSLPCRGTR